MDNSMRLLGVKVTPEFIGQFLKDGEVHLSIHSPIPKDAKLHHLFTAPLDEARRSCGDLVYLIFTHPSFQEMPEGGRIPIYDTSGYSVENLAARKKVVDRESRHRVK